MKNAKFTLSPNQLKNLKSEKEATKECSFTYPELRHLLTSVENQKFKISDILTNDIGLLSEDYKQQMSKTLDKLRKLEEKVSAFYVGELGAIIDKI